MKKARVKASILCLLLLYVLSSLPAVSRADSACPSCHFDALSQELSQRLLHNARLKKNASLRILVVNFVDLSQLHCTSRFGQLLPEKLRNQLLHSGWQIIEARRGKKVEIQEDTGPFILSDRTKDLARKIQCSAVLAGTYLYHKGTITVIAKLISVPDNAILSSATLETECDPYIFALLRPEGFGCPQSQAFIRIKPFPGDEFPGTDNMESYYQYNYPKEDSFNETD